MEKSRAKEDFSGAAEGCAGVFLSSSKPLAVSNHPAAVHIPRHHIRNDRIGMNPLCPFICAFLFWGVFRAF